VARLVRLVRGLSWEVHDTALEARLRENELLRLHRPRFNKMNTFTGGYWFVSVATRDSGIGLELSHQPKGKARHFGAFKGPAKQAFASLLRLTWAYLHGSLRRLPIGWLGERTARTADFSWPSAKSSDYTNYRTLLLDYYSGENDAIVDFFYAGYKRREMDSFQMRLTALDLETLEHFFDTVVLRQRALKAFREDPAGLILNDELDDLAVRASG
jgi:hypothetical protein